MATVAVESPPKPRTLLQLLAAHPTGFWFIFWGELAERCSYYGMMSILARFISEFLALGDGAGNRWVSIFKAACYFLPLLGGFLADQYLGKYRLIVIFSIPYILGHVILAGETEMWTLIALGLLAMGSGVIKPNISTLMGLTYDQKRPGDEQLRSLAFGMFYMAINIGAMISYAVLPMVRDRYGYSVAFLCPAVLMAISFVLFAVGKPFYAVETIQRRKSTPKEWEEKKLTIRRVAGLFLVVTFFWAIFDQSHTTWIYFARDFTDLSLFGYSMSPDQVGTINPFLIIAFVPLLTVFWGALEVRGIKARPTDKMMLGFILTMATMAVMALAGSMSGEYKTRPIIKGADESAPVIVATPDIDAAAIKEYQKREKKDTAPPIANATKLELIWIVQESKPTVTREGDATIIAWGKEDTDRIVLTAKAGASAPVVDAEQKNLIAITSPEPFTATYSGKAIVNDRKRVVAPSEKVTLWMEVLAFVVLTLAEVLISVTGLELAFVVSPVSMKGFVTALWLLTVGLANLFINAPIANLYETMAPAPYFAMLTGLMVAVIVVFYFVAKRFNALGEEQARLAREADLAGG
jgi:dipeptide/tripeptide permease